MPVPNSLGAGIWDEWTTSWQWSGYRTARAAMVAFLRHRKIERIWLPAYVCRALSDALTAMNVEIGWYAVDESLNARASDLAIASPGDAVLAIDYFGRSADVGLRHLACLRPDLLWIEDRAQALRPELLSFGDALLLSPRKLFGVGDGGVILVRDGDLPVADLPPVQEDIQPHIARACDPDGLYASQWFPGAQAREIAMDHRPHTISAATLHTLRTLDAEAEATARQRNWELLAASLSSIALWPYPRVDFVPLAYPVVVDDAAALSSHLASQRIWCARHWADLPSPSTFEAAHLLSRQCLSLPIDGRYDETDMTRIIDAIKAW